MELGAEFIHGRPAESWSLIEEARLETYELDGTAYAYEDSALHAARPVADDAFRVIEDMGRWWTLQTPRQDLSFVRYLREVQIPDLAADRARAYVEGFNAADSAHISVASLARQQRAENDTQGDRIFHIKKGYDSLPLFLAERFEALGGKILLSHQVRRIGWHDQGVAVSGASPAFALRARQAVITLPLGVLKSGQVQFSPGIQTLDGPMAGLAMGNVLRASFLFDQAFWNEAAPAMGFLFSPNQPIPTWWTSSPDSAPVLTGWIGGAHAFQRMGKTRGEDLVEAGILQLALMFKVPESRLRSMLQRVATHDWNADPLSLGAYSYVVVGGERAAEEFAKPLAGALFFAGEHTDPRGHAGTVHAALASGVRAAQQILFSSA